MRKTVVILDTNALFMPFQFGLNLDGELNRLLGYCEIVVPSTIRNELDRLVATKKKFAKEARALSEKYRLIQVRNSGDAALLELGKKLGDAIIVTNDKKLRHEAKKYGLKVVFLRARNHLVIT